MSFSLTHVTCSSDFQVEEIIVLSRIRTHSLWGNKVQKIRIRNEDNMLCVKISQLMIKKNNK